VLSNTSASANIGTITPAASPTTTIYPPFLTPRELTTCTFSRGTAQSQLEGEQWPSLTGRTSAAAAKTLPSPLLLSAPASCSEVEHVALTMPNTSNSAQ
jgi:hypothetical protein